jgi:hypothetical protein
MRTLLCLALAAGCSQSGTQVLAKVQTPLFAMYAGLRASVGKLPPSPVDEVKGGPLQPAAIFGPGGNTRFLPLRRVLEGAEVCGAGRLDAVLEHWLDLAQPGSPAGRAVEYVRGDDLRAMRAEAESISAARYVILYRMLNCQSPGAVEVEAFVVVLSESLPKVVRAVRITARPQPEQSLDDAVYDRLLGALAGRAGVEVRVSSASGGAIVAITGPEPPSIFRPLPPTSTAVTTITTTTGRCTVDTPEAAIEDPGGGMPCDEAEKLARDLRAKGFDAKVIHVK